MKFRLSYVLIPILALWCAASWTWFRWQLTRQAEAEAALPWKHTLRAHLPAGSNLASLLLINTKGDENVVVTEGMTENIGNHAEVLRALYGAAESEKGQDWRMIGRVKLTLPDRKPAQYLPLYLTREGHIGVEWDGRCYVSRPVDAMSAKVRKETL